MTFGNHLAWPINTAWMLACRRSLRRFERSCGQVAQTQQRLLRQTLRENQSSDFGRQHAFTDIADADAFRRRVPLSSDHDTAAWVARIADGEQNVLTTQRVERLEPTSGSVAGRRLIPYTRELRRQFHLGIQPWIADLFSKRPQVRRGRAYWSVTPAIPSQVSSGGVPIGFADDTQYLGLAGRLAARQVMAVPAWEMREVRMQDTIRETLLRLMTVTDLALVSVWSPTFLLVMLRELENNCDELLDMLAERAPSATVTRCRKILLNSASMSQRLERLWPRLSLVSCWADGAAGAYAEQLQQWLPHVEMQPKGLLSTEAFVSLPLVGQAGAALSVRSHFFEFLPVDATNEATLLAHEVQRGGVYRVIVTTGGGLYRYQTGDVVEVVGFVEQCPLLRFRGRAGACSDLVGEKLTDAFVSQAVEQTLAEFGWSAGTTLVVPSSRPLPRYRWLIDASACPLDSARIDAMTASLETRLCQNPYYAHAIEVGQLQSLQIRSVKLPDSSLWEIYQTNCLESGQRLGDIKPTTLETRFDWESLMNLC